MTLPNVIVSLSRWRSRWLLLGNEDDNNDDVDDDDDDAITGVPAATAPAADNIRMTVIGWGDGPSAFFIWFK